MRLCGPGIGGLGKFRRAKHNHDRPKKHGRHGEHEVDIERGHGCGRRLAAELPGRPLLPAVQSNIDFKQDHDDEQHRAESDLHPLVQVDTGGDT